ncbi:MAG TPA: ankyrin repeat domain-containing protein [Blastocatellia bacterium]|nr:ankyrin repeat domain-containing protein [Blastocatellia bacterium]
MVYVIGRVHTEAVQASLERANLDARPDDSLAGMMRAALIGHTAAVTLFLDYGVPVNAVDPNGRTPLVEAAFGGHIDTAEELLKRGADVNAQDDDGWTALMEAASKGRADFVRILLAHGADARIRNKKGWTALKTTAKCHIEITRLLREAGAD